MLRLAQRESEGGCSGQPMREKSIFMEGSSRNNRMGKLHCASPKATTDLGHSVNSGPEYSMFPPQPIHKPCLSTYLCQAGVGVRLQERPGVCDQQGSRIGFLWKPCLVRFSPALVPTLLCAAPAPGKRGAPASRGRARLRSGQQGLNPSSATPAGLGPPGKVANVSAARPPEHEEGRASSPASAAGMR